MTQHAALFAPLRLGAINAPNRVFMAPLTRNRAHADGTPSDLAAEYYRQRASAGLIIAEATQIDPRGKGYLDTPGIHADAHVAGWRKVTDAVHEAGGRIALQLWHVGRLSHVSLQPNGDAPLAPSALTAEAQVFTANGFEATSAPRALSTDEIFGIVAQYVAGAKRAMDAGFDAIEVHAANGYLIDQFLRDSSNQRDDAYGGSVENRTRFLVEVISAVTDAVGADRVGVRLSPLAGGPHMIDSDPDTTFGYAVDQLNGHGLAYLHFLERMAPDGRSADEEAVLKRVRARWNGVFIGNGAYDGDSGAAAVESGYADAIAFGRPFLANPDLPARIAQGAALNDPIAATFFGGDAVGYTDYPALESQSA